MNEDKQRQLLGDFPPDWHVQSLPEIVYFQEGPGITSDKFRENGTPFLNIRCFKNGYINREACQSVSPTLAHGTYQHFLLDEGDWVFSSSGTIGKVASIRKEDLPLMLNTSTIRFRSRDESLITREYVRVFLLSDNFRRQHSHQTQGSAQVNLGPTHLQLMAVPLPPLPEQRKIAAILTTVDGLIEKTEALIAKYQSVKQGLMGDLFTRGVDPKGRLRPPRTEAPQLYKQSELGWIPKEWEDERIGRVAHMITSGSRGWASHYADTGALFIRIGNLTREHINFRWDSIQRVQPPKSSEGERTRLTEGDVLVSVTADLGITAVVPSEMEEAYINQHIALIRLGDNAVNPKWLGRFLAGERGRAQFDRLNDAGAKSGLNLPAVSSLLFSLPPVSEQDAITQAFDSIEQQIETERQQLRKYQLLKTGLMQDLLTGKVRVHVDGEARQDG